MDSLLEGITKQCSVYHISKSFLCRDTVTMMQILRVVLKESVRSLKRMIYCNSCSQKCVFLHTFKNSVKLEKYTTFDDVMLACGQFTDKSVGMCVCVWV